MKKIFFIIFIFPLIIYCSRTENESEKSSLNNNNSKEILRNVNQNIIDFYNDKLAKSPFFVNEVLLNKTICWENKFIYFNTEGDRAVSVPIKDPKNSFERFLVIFIFNQKTTTIKNAYIIKFIPTEGYYLEYKNKDYDLFTGKTELYSTAGVLIFINTFKNGAIILNPLTKITLGELIVWGEWPWKCECCGYNFDSNLERSYTECPICGWSFSNYTPGGGSGGGGDGGDGGGGDGGGGGGVIPSTPANTVKEPLSRTDCSSSATANANQVNSVMNDNSSNYEHVDSYVNMLRNYASCSSFEYGMSVSCIDGQYFPVSQNNNEYIATSNSSSSVSIHTTNYTYLLAHTHPNGKSSAPSPSDAICLAQICKDGNNIIFSNIIIAADGSESAIIVSDRDKLNSFWNNADNNSFFNISNDNSFQTGSVWSNDYNEVCNNLLNQGYSGYYAQTFALSYVLEKYNTGLTISSRKNSTEGFKEQKTEKINSQYIPKKCP